MAASIKRSPIHNRGKVLLVITNTIAKGLTTEVDVLLQDMENEGWVVDSIKGK